MKKDIYLVTLIGFLFGWLALLPSYNLGFTITPRFILITVVGFTVLAPIALSILKLLSRRWTTLYQFGKFAAAGSLSTLIDLGVLNLLILLTGIATGVYFSVFKAFSFIIAVVNSYFWNKFWTFQSTQPVTLKEFMRFLFFTAIGLLINVSVASFMVGVVGSMIDVRVEAWANVSALVAVFVALMWNFSAYRYIVFRKPKGATNNQQPTTNH